MVNEIPVRRDSPGVLPKALRGNEMKRRDFLQCSAFMRKVVIRYSVDMVVDVLQTSTEDEVNFLFNESSHCSDNELMQLAEEMKQQD